MKYYDNDVDKVLASLETSENGLSESDQVSFFDMV